MSRPDLSFPSPPPAARPDLDFGFVASTDPVRREGPVLGVDEARAILGVGPGASWDELRDAYKRRIAELTGERRRVNTAYATLRLLAAD